MKIQNLLKIPSRKYQQILLALLSLVLIACGGGSGGETPQIPTEPTQTEPTPEPTPVDNQAPTPTLSTNSSSPTSVNTFTVTVSFDEQVENFNQNDISVSNATINQFENLQNDSQWQFELIAIADGMVTVNINSDVAVDLAGNNNVLSNTLSINYVAETTPQASNLVINPSFEDGSSPWTTAWNSAVENNDAYEGSSAVRVGDAGNNGSAEQIISGLSANTTYTLSAYAKVASSGGTINIGVKDYGGAELSSSATNTSYQKITVNFTTGGENTSAKIYAYRSAGNHNGYADSFSVVESAAGCYQATTSAGNTQYYINSATGDDCADGLSEQTAWQSLDNVNITTFSAGDQILFHDQSSFNGTLSPRGSGAANAHIVFGKYGDGDVNQRPIINGNGNLRAVYLHNQEYWQISQLEVINSANPNSKKRGIEVENLDAGQLNQIHIKNNYVHDIDGDNTKDTNGSAGIQVTVRKSNAPIESWYKGVYIENNMVVRADRTAINVSSAWRCRAAIGCNAGTGYVSHENVEIRNNYVEDSGGDGIVPINATGALVEYNLVNGANINSNSANVALWTWNSDDVLFQYNEAYNVKTTKDGQGYDVDYGQDNTIFQYNYSHDNEGGFMLVATGNGGTTTNAIIRYNISQNDSERLFHLSGKADGISIYNNTFYLAAGATTKPIYVSNWEGYPSNVAFYNNIFQLTDAGIWDGLNLIGGTFTFENNIVYGAHTTGEPASAINVNPLLVAPGTGTTGVSINGENVFGNFDGYKLQTGSPAIGTGTLMATAPSVDVWGNAISAENNPNIGAYAGSGE